MANEEIKFSNTVLVRGEDGKLGVYVDGTLMLGTINVQILNGDNGATMVLGLPCSRLRFGERGVPENPNVYETKDNGNVLKFSQFAKAQHQLETDPNMSPDTAA
jgi:hypothetical protein